MRRVILFGTVAMFAAAQMIDDPTGPRITPPTLNSVTPLGGARGTTVEMTIEGLNLAGASAIYFSEAGVKGKIIRVKELPDLPDIRLGSNGTPSTIDVGPLPPRNQVTVEVDIDPGAHVGPVRFRVLTPLGTSPEGSFLIEPYFGESPDREPNDSFEGAFETYLPSVLTGAISRPGDVDHFKIQAKAGEELVFENPAARIGSTLQPVVEIVAEDQSVVGRYGYEAADSGQRFAHRFTKDGTYYVRISDFEQSGRGTHFYRMMVGKLPVAASAYPLGLRRGSEKEFSVTGFNLGAGKAVVKTTSAEETIDVRPTAPSGAAFSEVKLALGDDPEMEASGTNMDATSAQKLALPVTVNGRVKGPQHFRLAARKGQKIVAEVNARRLGSELDSVLEILDAAGKPVERATVRAVWETFLVLRDHDSSQRGLRIQSWNVLSVGDWVMCGNEVMRVDEVPDGPDEDMTVESFGGQRRAFFGTSSEAHGVDRAVYQVQVHPPGAQFSPNGLPLVRLYYRNDDGGPGYGKDSWLEFTAPEDGEYLIRLADVRGTGGDNHAYRLSVRGPRPDFRLSVNPRNPNVPRGGVIPVTVTAMRREGFQGAIELELSGLPAGMRASANTIAAGQDSATILLSADADAKLDGAVAFEVTGRATINGRRVAHKADPDDRMRMVALMPRPDILMSAQTKVVELEPGQMAEVTVRVQRQNGFAGRIPVQVRDLPSRVRVTDSGLNGVLLNEDEDVRSFTLWALPNAEPVEGMIYVAGNVETRSPQQNSYAAVDAVLVRVKPATGQSSRNTAEKSGAAR